MASAKQVSDELKKQVKQALVRGLKKAAFLVEGDAKKLCPVAPGGGMLRASITNYVDENNLLAWVYTNVSYAPFVEYQTRPHIIKPKGKPEGANSLRWFSGNKPVFAKEVKHPGTSEQPFMRPAIDNNVEKIKRIFAKELNSIKK